jgi:hypothetical protein
MGVGIELKDRGQPMTFGSNLGDAEKRWPVGEIHAFWKEATEKGFKSATVY